MSKYNEKLATQSFVEGKVSNVVNKKADILKIETDISKKHTLNDTTENPIVNLNVYGESSQAQSPSPGFPQEIVNLKNPVIKVQGNGKNLVDCPEILELDATIEVDLLPGKTYTISYETDVEDNGQNMVMVQGYGEDGAPIISGDEGTITMLSGSRTFTTSVRVTKYAFFKCGEVETIKKLMIVEGETSGEYEPFIGQSVTIPYEMGGLTNESGVFTARDEIIVENDTVKYVQRGGKYICTGDDGIADYTGANPNVTVTFKCPHSFGAKVICSHYAVVERIENQEGYYDNDSMSYVAYRMSSNSFYIRNGLDKKQTNAFFLEQYNNGTPVTIVYMLKEPIITDITDTETGQALLALHTYKPSTTILCDGDCKITYKADTTNAFKNLNSELDTLKQAIISLGGTINV